MLYDQPDLLIQEEKSQVVEEWSLILLTQFVISATCDQNCLVARQVAHRMTESGRWRLTLGFDSRELSMHHLSVDHDGLKVAQLVLKLALLVLAAEEIDSFLDCVTLKDN